MNYKANPDWSLIQSKILKVLAKNSEIKSIRELTNYVNTSLEKEVEVSQSTINRIIKSMFPAITKVNGCYVVTREAASKEEYYLHKGLLLTHSNAYTYGNPDFFTVLTKETTNTRFVAESIMKVCKEEVVGYVLGENIIIFICGTTADRDAATEKIDEILGDAWREQEKKRIEKQKRKKK